MINILELLQTKPHNIHYLKRYLKFIQQCRESNKNHKLYFEEHHICPKAKDLFPEYSLFNENLWNKIELTSRQHIIAHVLLWKIFGGSQTQALDYIINRFNSDTNQYSLSKRKIPTSISIRYASKIREESRILSLGMATYKDDNNTKYYLHRDDSKIQELNLVGNNEGLKMSNVSKTKMSKAKDYNRKIKMYFLTIRKNIKI